MGGLPVLGGAGQSLGEDHASTERNAASKLYPRLTRDESISASGPISVSSSTSLSIDLDTALGAANHASARRHDIRYRQRPVWSSRCRGAHRDQRRRLGGAAGAYFRWIREVRCSEFERRKIFRACLQGSV